MKVIHVKSRPAYLCDPKRNKSCKKTHCFMNNGPCYMTLKKKNAYEGYGIFRYANMEDLEEVEE